MTDENLTPLRLDVRTTHAVEVQDAQANADEVNRTWRPSPIPGADLETDRDLIRVLVAVYGTERLIGMIETAT